MTLNAAYGIEAALRPTLEGIFVAQGHETFTTLLCEQLHRTNFPHLFPNAHVENGPVVILCLPETMKDEVEPLANSALRIVNRVGDHLKMTTCLVLAGATGDLALNAERFLNDIGADGLYFILVCGDQVLIVVHPWNEDCNTLAQFSMMFAGIHNSLIRPGPTPS